MADWIQDDIDEQTKTLLRLTMESPLTAKVRACPKGMGCMND